MFDFRSALNKTHQFCLKHKALLKIGLNATNAIVNVARDHNLTPILEGAFKVVDGAFLDDIWYPEDYFAQAHGWNTLFDGMFAKTLSKAFSIFPNTTMSFRNGKIGTIFSTEIGELAIASGDRFGENEKKNTHYRSKHSREEVIAFVFRTLFQSLGSEFMSCQISGEKEIEMEIYGESPPYIEGASGKYLAHLQNSFEKGIPRSIMLYGMPGCGKTVLANSLCRDLGLRTLILRDQENSFQIPMLKELIDHLEIKAVIIDDFDQIEHSNRLLELLAVLSSKVQLLIGISNSLTKLHPALLRPGRFDEVIKIDSLDVKTVKLLLGHELYKKYGAEVKGFPVAYLNELVKQNILLDGNGLDGVVKELGKRVKDQVKILKGGAEFA